MARGMPFPRPEFMRLALRLARRGKGRTSPNPTVGAVLVRGGRGVGKGYHRAAGMPHAEVMALRAAGKAARGADLDVTLEPCAHTGRTGAGAAGGPPEGVLAPAAGGKPAGGGGFCVTLDRCAQRGRAGPCTDAI